MPSNEKPVRPSLLIGSVTNGKPDSKVAAKIVVGYVVDTVGRVLFLKVKGPLDLDETLVAVPFSQLKHVTGQLVMQEGEAEATGAILIVPKG
jgi:hypothetical protein